MDEFAAAYFAAMEKAAGSQSKWEKLHAELYRLLSPAVARFTGLQDSDDEDDQETAEGFRADLNDYVRKYGFLAQIVPYRDAEWNGCTSTAATSSTGCRAARTAAWT
ncbi:hypothetical protein AMK31_17345 [Streptomyces sp. TSRI0107]|nr:hypothetical protein AMK31_17345 [Streptomyces sp. TSRI0107]